MYFCSVFDKPYMSQIVESIFDLSRFSNFSRVSFCVGLIIGIVLTDTESILTALFSNDMKNVLQYQLISFEFKTSNKYLRISMDGPLIE